MNDRSLLWMQTSKNERCAVRKIMSEREEAKAKRRHLIVSAAIECFIKNGIHQTGIRDIAELAGVSLGNLYNHFAGKDELIAEIAVLEGKELDQFAKMLDANEDAVMAIRKFADGYLDYVSQAENTVLTIEIIAEALRKPAIAEQFESNRLALVVALCETIKRGVSEGVMREKINIDETVRLLLDAIEGLGLRCGLDQIKPSKTARETLQEFIFRMLSP
jgi:TetR/AcrR family transcriptional repressor of uid operon